MKEIKLSDIINSITPSEYKVHFARKSGSTEPLNDYIADFEYWKDWNRYCTRNDFNRKYIFSLISFYPEHDTWLFGGVWEVISCDMNKTPYPYEIKLVDAYS
ncbi:MAG: hypothetical protein K6B44_00710 [Lachnospiraceae bacterium]|nr:hypothetical protein [Lachnospiraceae bacterium]